MEQTSRHKIILLNGPPKSGKDTIADYFCSKTDSSVKISFAHQLKQSISAILKPLCNTELTEEKYNEIKDKPMYALTKLPSLKRSDITLRQWMIEYAEKFMKPTLGYDIFAQFAYKQIVNELNKGTKYIIISDLGFIEELVTILTKTANLKYADDIDIYLLKLYREGTSFAQDSRKYIQDNVIVDQELELIKKITVSAIHNNGTVENAFDEMVSIICTEGESFHK